MDQAHRTAYLEIPDAEQRREVLLRLRYALMRFGQATAELDQVTEKARALGLVEAVKHVEQLRKAA